MAISRRDFLNGVALSIGYSVSPLQAFGQGLIDEPYPPAKMGLRGHHPGSFEAAHSLALEGKRFDVGNTPLSEDYDLVIVGAGLSGLAAAWFYRQAKPDARILLLDNHDDFGGHAKRNEFTVQGRTIIGYGGSESFQSPKALFNRETLKLMQGLNVDIERLKAAFDRNLFRNKKLVRGTFFDKGNFPSQKFVIGDPQALVADDMPKEDRIARSWQSYIADFPLSEKDRADLIKLHTNPDNYLPGKTPEESAALLAGMSYHNFLRQYAGLSETAAKYFRNRPNDFTGFCSDSLPAFSAYMYGYPGFSGMALPPPDEEATAEMSEPYVFHFPDGNASLARLIVRALIPKSAPGNTMDDIVQARFAYDRLDEKDNLTRIRLNSLAIDVRNVGSGVEVTYLKNGALAKVRAKKSILACFNMIIPSIAPQISTAQAQALKRNVKIPLVYTKVILRNWEPFLKAGAYEIYSPTLPYSRIKLDYPVNMGGYHFPEVADGPASVHMVYTPTPFASGTSDGREQVRMGRAILLGMSFADHEAMIKDQLNQMFSGFGFSSDKDIMAITVNRWSHGYSWSYNSLFDDLAASEAEKEAAKKPFGNIAIANSDAGWAPYVPGAVREAWRAVEEIS